MRWYIFFYTSLYFLSRVTGSPVQNNAVKRGLEVTNSRITQFDDIRQKKHDFVLFNPETHQAEKHMGTMSAQQIDISETLYKYMENEKRPFKAEIRAPWINHNDNGEWSLFGEQVEFWSPATPGELKRKLDDGTAEAHKAIPDAIQSIQDKIQELASDCGRKITRIIGIGTGSLHRIFPIDDLNNKDAVESTNSTNDVVEIILQEKMFSDDENKFYPSLSRPSLTVRVVEDPDAFGLINDETLLVAINTGDFLIKLLDMEKLPGMILTDTLTNDWGKEKEPVEGKKFQIYKQISISRLLDQIHELANIAILKSIDHVSDSKSPLFAKSRIRQTEELLIHSIFREGVGFFPKWKQQTFASAGPIIILDHFVSIPPMLSSAATEIRSNRLTRSSWFQRTVGVQSPCLSCLGMNIIDSPTE
ncbi:hypothetical protein N7492_001117 [Penicillium capsulatum]|uniref:SRR1-like domain-containing protein n=1 Tax=Penicillium capsulatum TaxID=69766 RepID=A0A9W9IU30_9EURO|nr:hypothetical protein N7492_001117 [Penicillium capsulatum]KAJ6129826.1 hypothetical protein N7512_002606 [Penicillium capsulatum]